jgi:ABC-type transporter Mla maintaining outer membrane lipid asymmetry ATPase subunit MlaF
VPRLLLRDVVKDYRGLRPLRVRELAVDAGEAVTVSGLDEAAAAVLTDLMTGSTLPDSGTVLVDGHSTAEVSTADGWLAFLDQFGLVNPRVVLQDGLTVAGNLAMPLTLDLDPIPPGVLARVERLAAEVGLAPGQLDAPLASATAGVRARVRLGRALAHDPRILLLEHPTVALEPADASRLAAEVARLRQGRDVAILAVTSDRRFSDRLATRALAWRAATGELAGLSGWRRWFG